MLHIILLILKITGILVLILLGILLGVLLLVLLVPVRYQIDGVWADRPKGRAKITWLLHMVSVTAAYEEDFSVVIRLFGIRILKPAEESREDAKEELVHAMEATKDEAVRASEETLEDLEKDEGQKEPEGEWKAWENEAFLRSDEPEDTDFNPGAGSASDPGSGTGSDSASDSGSGSDSASDTGADTGPDSGTGSDPDSAPGTGPDSGPFSRLTERFRRLAGRFPVIFGKLKFSFQSMCDKLRTIKEKKEEIQEWISKEENQKTIRLLCRQAKKLLRHVLPQKGRGEVVFGFEDPYTTGQVLTAFSVIYPFCHENLVVYPVFDRQVFTAEGYFKGRIRLGTLIMAAVRLLFDKNCRMVLKRWLR